MPNAFFNLCFYFSQDNIHLYCLLCTSSVENTTLKHIIHKVLGAYIFSFNGLQFYVYAKKLLTLMPTFLMLSWSNASCCWRRASSFIVNVAVSLLFKVQFQFSNFSKMSVHDYMDVKLGIPVQWAEKIISKGSVMAVLNSSASWGQGEKWSEGKGDCKYLLL